MQASSKAVIHDLALALDFGGSFFGKLALDPGVKAALNPSDRGRMVTASWGAFTAENAVAIATYSALWMSSRRHFMTGSRYVRTLAGIKDVLLGIGAASFLGNAFCGALVARPALTGALPLESGVTPEPVVPPRNAFLHRASVFFGWIHFAAVGGLVGVGALLERERTRRFGLGAFRRRKVPEVLLPRLRFKSFEVKVPRFALEEAPPPKPTAPKKTRIKVKAVEVKPRRFGRKPKVEKLPAATIAEDLGSAVVTG